jgi:hypothetical protein
MLPFNRVDLLSKLPKNSIGAEIGVDKGEFSELILEKINPSLLYLIDPWTHMLNSEGTQLGHSQNYESVKEKFKNEKVVKILKMSSKEASSVISDGSLDWVYIDGDHSYQGCLYDLVTYGKKIKDNGFICGHDIVVKQKKGFGVNEAVDTFIKDTGFYLQGFTNETNFKSFVISKNKNINLL